MWNKKSNSDAHGYISYQRCLSKSELPNDWNGMVD